MSAMIEYLDAVSALAVSGKSFSTLKTPEKIALTRLKFASLPLIVAEEWVTEIIIEAPVLTVFAQARDWIAYGARLENELVKYAASIQADIEAMRQDIPSTSEETILDMRNRTRDANLDMRQTEWRQPCGT